MARHLASPSVRWRRGRRRQCSAPSINQSINQSTNQSINQPINQSFDQSFNHTINQAINHDDGEGIFTYLADGLLQSDGQHLTNTGFGTCGRFGRSELLSVLTTKRPILRTIFIISMKVMKHLRMFSNILMNDIE